MRPRLWHRTARALVAALATVLLLDAVGLAYGHFFRRWRRQQPPRGPTTD